MLCHELRSGANRCSRRGEDRCRRHAFDCGIWLWPSPHTATAGVCNPQRTNHKKVHLPAALSTSAPRPEQRSRRRCRTPCAQLRITLLMLLIANIRHPHRAATAAALGCLGRVLCQVIVCVRSDALGRSMPRMDYACPWNNMSRNSPPLRLSKLKHGAICER